jgi:hypothetical protein
LVDSTEYVAYALVNSQHVYESFTLKTSAGGVAILDSTGHLPASQVQQYKPISEWLSFGHSLTTGFGGSSQEFSWPARLAKTLGADLEVYGQNGAILAVDDTTAPNNDGGYATVFKRLKSTRTAAPYLAAFGAVSLHYGLNDLQNYGTATATRDTFKAALRGCIGIARTSRWIADNDGAVTKSGASHSFLASQTEDKVPRGRFAFITAADGSYWELAVPSDYEGNQAVWVYLLSGTTTGGVANVTVDGSAPSAINNAAATTIDNRNQCLQATFLSVQAYRIPIAAAGAHTVRITPTTVLTSMSVLGFGIEATKPNLVIVPQSNKMPSYSQFSGAAFPPTDTTIDTLSSWISAVAGEFPDGRVLAPDIDTPLAKLARYFYSDSTHYNDEGSEVVAGAVLDSLRSISFDSRGSVATAKKGLGRLLTADGQTLLPCGIGGEHFHLLGPCHGGWGSRLPTSIVSWSRIRPRRPRTGSTSGSVPLVPWSAPRISTRPRRSSTAARSGLRRAPPRTHGRCGRLPTRVRSPSGRLRFAGPASIRTSCPSRSAPSGPPAPTRSRPFPEGRPRRGFRLSARAVSASSEGIVLPAGQTISNITFFSGTQAAVTPTNQIFAIYRQSNLARLAVTADALTAAWAATAFKTLALTGTYTPDVDMPVYIGVMVAAATVPNLTGTNTLVQQSALPPIRHGSADTGLTTTLPATAGALTAQAGVPYAYVA